MNIKKTGNLNREIIKKNPMEKQKLKNIVSKIKFNGLNN